MKKSFLVLLILLLTISLCGCDSQDYAEAEALFAEGKYAEALPLYENLGNYEQSAERVKACNYQLIEALFAEGKYTEALPLYEALGDYEQSVERVKACNYQLGKMAFSNNNWELAIEYLTDLNYEDSEKIITDCNFLLDLQSSILNRMEQNKRNTDYTTLTNSELIYLGKYKDAEFSDPEIEKYAKDYLDGLYKQKESLSLKYSEYQLEWARGYTQRYHVLNELLLKRDFLSDNMDFVTTYSLYDEALANLKKIEEVEQDIFSQIGTWGVEFEYVSNYEFALTYTNNTDHTYDLLFYFTLKDSNDVRVGEFTKYFTGIQPHSENKLIFPSPCTWYSCDFFWEIYEIN